MSYRGRVENGVIVADGAVDLPDGTVVEFQPIKLPSGHHHPDVERFAGVIASDVTVDDYFDYLRKKHA